jgi:hypothetical protein
VWSVDGTGPTAWGSPISGRLVSAGERIFLHAADGVYLLDPETLSAKQLFALPRGSVSAGDMVALPDGGLLVAHQDAYDRRLIALYGDGTLRWERSFAHILRGRLHLLTLGQLPFLVSEDTTTSAAGELTLLAVDLEGAQLTRIFTGGNRGFRPGPSFALAVGDERALVNVGGGRLVMLNTRSALEAVSPAGSSQ